MSQFRSQCPLLPPPQLRQQPSQPRPAGGQLDTTDRDTELNENPVECNDIQDSKGLYNTKLDRTLNTALLL